MAHIADCMMASTEYGLNNFIAKELTPQSSAENLPLNVQHVVEEKEKYVWRMHQPTEPRKYQLFPLKEKLSIASLRSAPESEKAAAQNRSSKTKEPPSILRRKKPSLSDLGQMKTVPEVPMDSPTIPGRPPLHERSISAPGHGWRQNVFGDTMVSMISQPTIEEKPEGIPDIPGQQGENGSSDDVSRSMAPRLPGSPSFLTKLVIPDTTLVVPDHLISKPPSGLAKANNQPPGVPPKSTRMTPKSQGSVPTPSSNSSTSLFPQETPGTAPSGSLGIAPWDLPLTAAPTSAPPALPAGHFRNRSEQPVSRVDQPVLHRREQSETSIMDRGRPKKKSACAKKAVPPRTPRELTDDEIAYATLPTGFRAVEADSHLEHEDLEALRKQAVGQAAKFEVLTSRDVEGLSRELRGLDERCEYLRKTHRSLRAGRRNLHERMCAYLRSPRVARFSHSAILKQEEALIELDVSIDDWVYKLEQAENRRIRVRQKLLEHVAAALTLKSPAPSTRTPPLNTSHRHRFIGDRFHHDTHEMNTPPRSPTKTVSSSSSPPRSPSTSSTYTAHDGGHYEHYASDPHAPPVPSPKRLAEHVRIASPEPEIRMSSQSIKIYADSDVYALLADVEEEINRMGELEYDESPACADVPAALLRAATYDSSQAGS